MRKSKAIRAIVFIGINLLVGCLLYISSIPLWNRPVVPASFKSLAAVLSSLSFAIIISHHVRSRQRTLLPLSLAFLFHAVIEIGGAMEKQFLTQSPLGAKSDFIMVTDLIDVAVFLTFVLIAVIIQIKSPDSKVSRKQWVLGAIAFLSALMVIGVLRFYALIESSFTILSAMGAAITIYILLTTSLTCSLLIKKHRVFPEYGTIRMVTGVLLFGTSALCMVYSLYTIEPLWILGVTFQITALFTFYIGISVQHLRQYDVSEKRNAETFLYSVATSIILLLLITMVIELVLPNYSYQSPDIVMIANMGSIAMSVTITAFTVKYTELTEKEYLKPAIFIYALWIAAGTIRLAFRLLYTAYEMQSMAYYLVVVVLTIPGLALSASNLVREREHLSFGPRTYVILGLLIGSASMAIAEYIRIDLIASLLPNYSAWGRALLLLSCLVAFSQLLYISVFLFERNRGNVELDSVSFALLSFWLVPGLLKGNFIPWTVGWWTSEAVLLVGLFIAPGILGFMYLQSSFRAMMSERRSRVYADLLAHDITNHHQIIMNTLELCLMPTTPDTVKVKNLKDAYKAIIDADRLVRNVRKLGKIETQSKRELSSCSLRGAIKAAIEIAQKSYPDARIRFESETNDPCNIHANEFLTDIFINLIFNAIEHSGNEEVLVTLSLQAESNDKYWEVRVIDRGPGISPEIRERLFSRYMKGAKGTGLGLSLVHALTELYDGRIWIENRIPGDYKKGSCFTLRFPVAEGYH